MEWCREGGLWNFVALRSFYLSSLAFIIVVLGGNGMLIMDYTSTV